MKAFWVVAGLALSVTLLFCKDMSQIHLSVGNKNIHIKSPENFHEVTRNYPEYKKIGEMFTPPQNLFLAMFLPEEHLGFIMKDEYKVLERYITLQTLKDLSLQRLSRETFKETKNKLEKNIMTLLERIVNETNARLDETGKRISTDYNTDFKVQINKAHPLGIAHEEENALVYSMLIKAQNQLMNKKIETEVIVGTSSIIFVNGAFLMLHVFSGFESQKDIDWAEDLSIKFAKSILDSNK